MATNQATKNVAQARATNNGLTGKALVDKIKAEKAAAASKPSAMLPPSGNQAAAKADIALKTNHPSSSAIAPTAPAKTPPELTSFGSKPSLTGYASEAGITPEMELTDQARGVQAAQEELFGKSQLDIKAGENLYTIQAKRKQEQDLKDTESLKRDSDLAAQQEAQQLATMKQQERGATAAVIAGTAGGREGIMSEGNQTLGKQVSTEMNQRIDMAAQQVAAATMRRDQAIQDLAMAQEQGNEELAASYTEALARAENSLMDADAARAKTVADANQQGIDMIGKITSLSEGLSGAFASKLATMDVPAIQAAYGLDAQTAQIFQTSAINKSSIDKTDPEYRKKMADADRAEQDALFAGMTTEQRNFNAYKTMLSENPEQAKLFAEQTGIMERPETQNFLADYTKKAENAQKIYDQTGVRAPINSKYAYDLGGGGISFERSAPAGTVLGRGQCGEFVNDALNGGPGLMGNTFESKINVVNSSNAVAGAAFVEDTGDWTGHTGIVERVYPDGSFDTRESNYVSPNTVSTAHVAVGSARWQSIVEQGGFHVPGESKSKEGGPEAIAKAIFDGNSSLTLKDLKQEERAAVDIELGKLREDALSSGDVYGAMKASAGGAKMDPTSKQQFIKTATVIKQLSSLNSRLNSKKIEGVNDEGKKISLNPLKNFIQKKNPWSADAQEISAMLQATIPNLARGVYGEVGVLTDQDVELYKKTLPNLSQPDEIRKSITAMTLRTLRNSLQDQIEINAGAGLDMSGLVPKYKELDDSIKKMEAELGISEDGVVEAQDNTFDSLIPELSGETDYNNQI
jgi:hypothetical protein